MLVTVAGGGDAAAADRVSQAGRMAGSGNRITLIGDLIVTCKRTDIAQPSDRFAGNSCSMES